MDFYTDYEIITLETVVDEKMNMEFILINSFELSKTIENNNNNSNKLSIPSTKEKEKDEANEEEDKQNKTKPKEEEREKKEDISTWTKVKFKYANLTNKIKYNTFDLNTLKLDKSNNSSLHFFNQRYKLNNPNNYKELQKCLHTLIYYSYRKNFPIVINYNTNKKYSSDCGWGCMIRSAQMLLSRALFKYFLFCKNKHHHSIMYSLFFCLDKPLAMDELPSEVYFSMIKKYLDTKPLKEDYNIKSIYPPFSIHTIIQVSQFLGKNPGDFYSDVHMGKIFSLINTHFNVIRDLSIVSVQNSFNQKDLLFNCFTTIKVNDQEIEYKGERYYFNKCGLFLVSIRLGLNKISSSYFDSIKDIFRCNQCIGLIGGKNISAFYFIGYDKEHLFYLDPHLSQDSIEDTSTYETYLKKTVHKMKIESMQAAFTAGFLVLSIEDYREMVDWIEKHEKNDFKCMSLSKKSFTDEEYIASATDDF